MRRVCGWLRAQCRFCMSQYTREEGAALRATAAASLWLAPAEVIVVDAAVDGVELVFVALWWSVERRATKLLRRTLSFVHRQSRGIKWTSLVLSTTSMLL
jgi:hypothetical protein